MQLAADANMQIVQPTTASQIFHVLRRQMVRTCASPGHHDAKSPAAQQGRHSPLSEFTKGGFQTVIPEQDDAIEKRPSQGQARDRFARARCTTTW